MIDLPDEQIAEVPSKQEMERRKKAILEGMRKQDLDILLLQTNSQRNACGYIRYLINKQVMSFYEYLLLDADGTFTYVAHYGGSAVGIKAALGIEAHYVPWNQTNAYALDGAFVADLIRKKSPGKLGLAPFATLSADFYDRLIRELPEVKIVDATDVVESVKMVKSAEEQKFLQKSVAIGDLAMETFAKVARPGRTFREIIADVSHAVKLAGSEDQFWLVGRPPKYFDGLNGVLKTGDVGIILAELSGPGGYWSDTQRTYSVGTPTSAVVKAVETSRETQRRASECLVSGGSLPAAYEIINEGIKDYAPITRAYGHGQGIDIYERPTIHKNDKTTIRPGMEFSVHPDAISKDALGSFSDNFLVTEGKPRRWQKTPQEIIVLPSH